MSNSKSPLYLATSNSYDQLKKRPFVYSPLMISQLQRNEQLNSKPSRGIKSKHKIKLDLLKNNNEAEEKYSKETRKVSFQIPTKNYLTSPSSRVSTRPTTAKSKGSRILGEYDFRLENEFMIYKPEDFTDEEKKSSPVRLLVEKIISERRKAADKIKNFIKMKRYQRQIKLLLIIMKVLAERRSHVIKIQTAVRLHLVRKNITKFLKMMRDNYTIFYYPEQREICSVRMIVEQDNYNKLFNLCYNEFLDCFYLFVQKQQYARRKYKFNFVVNDKIVIDTNFDTFAECDGRYYNILDFAVLKHKGYITNLKEFNGMKNLFAPRRKLTYPMINCPTVAREPPELDQSEYRDLKPCLKKSVENLICSPKKKVSFNLIVNYCD